MEAIATRVEAIATRVEAIATRVEAIATRVEAIATSSKKLTSSVQPDLSDLHGSTQKHLSTCLWAMCRMSLDPLCALQSHVTHPGFVQFLLLPLKRFFKKHNK